MVGCFVFGCNGGYKNGVRRHNFKLPANCDQSLRTKWIHILFKCRSDKRFDPSNSNHRVCSRHFEDKYLIKDETVVIGNETIHIPRERWILTNDAFPTLFPSIPKNPVKISPKKRRSPEERKSGDEKKRCKVSMDLDVGKNDSGISVESNTSSYEILQTEVGTILSDSSIDLNLDRIEVLWNQTETPAGWELKHVKNQTERCYIYELDCSTQMTIKRQVIVDKNMNLEAWVEGHTVTNSMLIKKLYRFEDLQSAVTRIQGLHSCDGFPDFVCEKIPPVSGIIMRKGRWFSNRCEEVGPNVICTPCKTASIQMYQKQFRKPKRQNPDIPKLRIRNRYYRRRIRKLVTQRKNVKMELLELRTSIKNLNTTDLKKRLDTLQHVKVDHGTRLTLIQIINSAKANTSTGIRYSAEWLLECTLLRIKSPAAYKHIRDTKILPLPHPTTIKRLIAASPSQFGFSEIALDAIKREFNGKSQRDRQGVLVFDEVKLRKTLDFNKGTLKFDGYVDFGEFTQELTSKTELADHALVYAYRPYNSDWVQPIAVFATKGAAKGPTLAKLLIECVSRLEAVGAEVLATVSDGATTNKNLWKHLGVSGAKGKVVNKIIHPCDDKRFLFFCSDVPHIIKCVRNHFGNHRKLLFDGDSINYDFYEELYKLDNCNSAGLKRCPKLTKAHIWPNSFEKMRVNYATQLLSGTVASGLRFYRSLCPKSLEGSENTEKFTIFINNIFDILNSRLPLNGLTPNSKDMETLKRFYQLLNSDAENTFASKQTIESIRVTIKSTIEITEYLCNGHGFRYVLTAKLNQDCLEKFFGLIRAAGGREEHPTVANFVQLYRLLSVYTPIKRVVRGNITSNERLNVLVNFTDSLKNDGKLSKLKRLKARRLWEDALRSKIIDSRSMFATYHSQRSSSDIEKNLVYHLMGFVVKKASKLLKCQDCIATLRAGDQLPPQAFLTKSIDNGTRHRHLVYPSTALFELFVNFVEPVVVCTLENGQLYGDALLRIIERLSDLRTNLIGCDEYDHNSLVLCKLVPYYIMVRFHFFSNAMKQDMVKLSRTQRKLSKLQES